MRDLFLPEDQLPRLLDVLEEEFETILFTRDATARYSALSAEERQHISLRQPRSNFAAKSFFLPLREHLAEYGAEGNGDGAVARPGKPYALVNLRNCDVEAIRLLDQIFLEGDYVDPFYQKRRDEILVVSVDCASITEFCFCRAVGYENFVERSMGINLSPVSGGYVVRADAERGEAVLAALAEVGTPVEESHREAVDQRRREMEVLLDAVNEPFAVSRPYCEILKDDAPPEKWNDLFTTCVECTSCTNICPTCFCFYMFDQRKFPDRAGIYEKLRSWDSCLLADYSRMAGAGGAKANPRARLRSRYENRYRHKYQYHYESYGCYGCVGCGRCAQSCLGATDPREVMRVLDQ